MRDTPTAVAVGYVYLAQDSGAHALAHLRRALRTTDPQDAAYREYLAGESAMLAAHWARLAMMAGYERGEK